jgi:RNA polymerase sigma-70 factor (ECF subfamily)
MLDFSDTYDEYLPRVYAFVGYRLTNRADAEDLTQQTFERALAHWAEYDRRRASIATWLLSIARNLVIDYYRAGARRADVHIGDAAAEFEGPSAGSPEPNLGVSPELGAALAALSDRERELIALRFGADLASAEIARLTGLTLANTQQVLSRALRKLRVDLDGETGDKLAPRECERELISEPGLDTDHLVG